MSKIRYLLFDAANTLIHKPQLWERWALSLKKYGYEVPDELLKKNHKLISECMRFPDRTSREFYKGFNSELLYSMGIVPTAELLDEIFTSCTYLPWEKFEDTKIMASLDVPKGILSNFNNTLKDTIDGMYGNIFKHIFISENYGVAKPDPKFYEIALKEIGLAPDEILYIGDSIRLDMEPAVKTGLDALLIDRDNVYPAYKNRITSLEALTLYL